MSKVILPSERSARSFEGSNGTTQFEEYVKKNPDFGSDWSQHQRDKRAYLNATPMQREVVRRLLCDVLGCLRASYLSYQTSHWQVVGQSFYGNHLLFARLYESVQKQVDELAEKLVGYLGREVVGLDHQIKHIAGYTMRWSQIDCHHKRGLQSEADLQAALKRAYDGIKQVNAMTLGLDDWIMATANAHEENEYLLQQALTPVLGQKQASTNPEAPDRFMEWWEFLDPNSRKRVLESLRIRKDRGWNALEWERLIDYYVRTHEGGQGYTRSRHFASFEPPDGFYLERHAPMGRDGINNYEYVNKFDPAARYWKPMDKQELNRILAYWKRTKADWAWRWEEVRNGRVVNKDSGSGTRFEGSYDGPGIYDSDSDSYFRRRRSAGAPTAEGDFYDNPEKREVLEFANSGAISNSPEVAAAAAADGELDVSETKAVAEAEEAPPTPDEIKEEAGGSAVSTLNRFVVETEDPAVEPAVKMNELRERQARLQEAFANWSSVRTARLDKLVFKPGRGVVEWDHAKKSFSVDQSDAEKILGHLRGDIYLYSVPNSKLYRFVLNPARRTRYWKYDGPEGLSLLVWK